MLLYRQHFGIAGSSCIVGLNLLHTCWQGLYVEMKFERPSRIQALTLPMILEKQHRGMIAQVGISLQLWSSCC